MKLDFTEKILCNIVGKMFAYTFDKLEYDLLEYINTWLTSDIFRRIIDQDPTIICQSHVYWYVEFEKSLNLQKQEISFIDEDALYWLGYILTYWIYLEDLKDGTQIIQKYNVISILEKYDVYHTLSCEETIYRIKNR